MNVDLDSHLNYIMHYNVIFFVNRIIVGKKELTAPNQMSIVPFHGCNHVQYAKNLISWLMGPITLVCCFVIPILSPYKGGV